MKKCKFEKIADNLIASEYVYLSSEGKKLYDDMTESEKKYFTKNMKNYCKEVSAQLAIETLCVLIQDLSDRIDKLEKN